MKRAAIILLTLILLATGITPCYAITTYYMDKFEEAAGSVNVPIGDPEVVGWSEPLHIDEKNYIPSYDRYSDYYPSAELSFAYGDKGLYLKADITDEDFIFTTGRNEFSYGIDMYKKESDFYAWNGDVLIFTIDPANILLNSGLTLASDYEAWLCFAMNEDEEVLVRRTRFGEADLTNEITSKGSVTDKGWSFEACIPWDIIASLVDLTSFGIASFDKEDIMASGTLSKACVIFMDRYFDNETENVETGNRLATLELNSYEGALCPSFAPNPVIGSYGISLYTEKAPESNEKSPLDVEFPDVSKSNWYFTAVEYTARKGIFKGMANGRFEPSTTLTRAMFVSILQRFAEAEAESGYSYFSDVPKSAWYTAAVNWASENKIVNGVGNGKFAPNKGLSRAEAVTMLFRYFTEYDRSGYTSGEITGFDDTSSLPKWSLESFKWASENGIIKGISSKGKLNLAPNKTITRAETAQMMMNFANCTPIYEDEAIIAETEYSYISTSLISYDQLKASGLYTDNSDHSDMRNSVPIYNGGGFESAGDFNACYSDPKLVERVSNAILEDMENNPDKTVFFLTPYEHSYFCLCADCEAAGREEGSRGGAFIKMLRSISAKAAERFPENKILIYISDFNLDPPTEPYPDNVIPCARLNNRCYSHAICDENCTLNRNIKRSLDKIAEYCDSFYIAESISSGEYYLAPLFALDSLYSDFQYFHSLGMEGYFSYIDDYNDGNFKDLYSYLRLCLLAYPNMTRAEYSRHIRVFLSKNYGEAANEIRDYIDFASALQNEVHFSSNAAVNVTMPKEFSDYIEYFDSLIATALAENTNEEQAQNTENSTAGYKFIRQVFLFGITPEETYRAENEALWTFITQKKYKWSHRSPEPIDVNYSRSPLYWN